MDIIKLESKHYDIHFKNEYKINPPAFHTKLSIEFAISVLEDFYHNATMDYEVYKDDVDSNEHVEEILETLDNKINELKNIII